MADDDADGAVSPEAAASSASMTGLSLLRLLAGGLDVFAMAAARRGEVKGEEAPYPVKTPGVLPIVQEVARSIVEEADSGK